MPCLYYLLVLCFTGIAENSHLRSSNYFYYNCLTGHFLRDNCPSYLTPAGFAELQRGAIERLSIASGFFMQELRARKYTKVGMLMMLQRRRHETHTHTHMYTHTYT